MLEEFMKVLVQTSPQLAIAALAIVLNYKLIVVWMRQVEVAYQDTAKNYMKIAHALGEVTEALRKINGK